MQFAVPQFTDVEDKLIGPLTLRQFLFLLATGGIVLFFWSLTNVGLPNIAFWAMAVFVGSLGVYVAMGKYNGRQVHSYLLPFMTYLSSPKVMIFHRETVNLRLSNLKVVPEGAKKEEPKIVESPASRLKKLAYTLDQKFGEERELVK